MVAPVDELGISAEDNGNSKGQYSAAKEAVL